MVLKKRTKKNLFLAGMLIVPAAHFVVFWGIANFNLILLAFQGLNPTTQKVYWTFNNFRMIWALFGKYGALREALGNTLLTWGFLCFFLLPWSFVLTYFIYKKIRLSPMWRTVLFLPTLLPAVAMASIFTYIIYPDAPFGKFMALFAKNIPAFLNDPRYAKWTIVFYIFWTNFGGSFILISGAMARVPKEIIESAYLDGAGMGTELRRILFPLCWPTLSTLLLLNTAGLFMASGPVLILTYGENGTATISFWIFNQVNKLKNYYTTSALGLACTLVLFPIVLLVRWGLSKIYANVEF